MSQNSAIVAAAGKGLSYDETKRLANDKDPAVRARLAERQDVRPEIHYYLAEDPTSQVRCKIAANRATPAQADLLLARDSDESVRLLLAQKISILLPELDAAERLHAQCYILEVIEVLARDQVTRVRQILAETLKDMASIPPRVVQRLAHDLEDAVACPVLEFSPLLDDRDLLEIIESGCVSGRLRAISRRRGVGELVANAVVARKDRSAISTLLDNKTAQIREETLDELVEAAAQVTAWHEPLVRQPKLSLGAVRKLARFVAASLLEILERRKDLDRKTARAVAKEVDRCLKEAQTGARENEPPEARAKRLHGSGGLGDEELSRALGAGDRDLIRHGLALRADLPIAMVDHILSAHSAKGVTALAWKAGCSMRLATQLQLRLGGIAPSQALNPRSGTDYPLSSDEMTWQLDFFHSLAS